MTATGRSGEQVLAKPVVDAQRIVVRDLTLSCCIGVSVAERAQQQRLRLSVELAVDIPQKAEDQIGAVVDYGQIVGLIRQVCRDNQAVLLETLAQDIAEACFFDPRVRRSRIRIEKLDRYADVGGIGVELEHSR